MSEGLRSMAIGTAGLGAAAVVAVFLTLTRGGIHASREQLRSAVRLAVLTVALQALHFLEELAGGLSQRLPEVLGLAPWPPQLFVAFNLFWLVAWALSIWGLAARLRAALFPLWFLCLGCVLNLVVHPILAARAGSYFPGLVTSVLVGVAGVLMLGRMLQITRSFRGTGSAIQ